MNVTADIFTKLREMEGVTGAVVWRLGDAPVGDLGGVSASAGAGLLAAGIGSMEHVVEAVGLGQIEELWFVTHESQCLAIRVGHWQAVLIGGIKMDVEMVRDRVTEMLSATENSS